jgi:hypothetical protein
LAIPRIGEIASKVASICWSISCGTAYVNPIDQQIVKTGVGVPGRPFPCSYEEVQDGVRVITSQPTDLCVKMLPQQHWRGLWRNDFEGSRFCPEPAKRCSFDAPGERIWLSKTPGRPQGGLYQLDFIGRKTMYRGPYGHMGVFDEEITIDRVLSMKELQAPPPPPTEAEFLSQMKKCRADGTCIPSPEEQAKIKAEAASILKAAECKAARNCSSASKDGEAKH